MPLDGGYPLVFVDGICLKRNWGGSYENATVPVAIGVNFAGGWEVIGCSEGYTESADSWREFFSRLRGGAGSPACGSSPATGARGRSVRSRRFFPGPAAGVARCIFSATCWEGFP